VALTADEATLVNLAFFEGPAALLEAGIPPAAVGAFFEREDIQVELRLLKEEFDHHDALKVRAKFFIRRSLHRLIDPATAVLAMALAGPDYHRDKNGIAQRDSRGHFMVKQPEPTKVQVEAAKTVMTGVGLNDFRITSHRGMDNQLETLFRNEETARSVDYEELGQTEAEQILARERIRTAISKLAPRLPAAREEFREQFRETLVNGGQEGRKKKTKRKAKKKAKKKAAKKGVRRKPARKRSNRGAS